MMILSKNTISELYNAYLLIYAIYQSTAEHVGRPVYINWSCLPSHINASYQATAEAEGTEQIKQLLNLVHSVKKKKKQKNPLKTSNNLEL